MDQKEKESALNLAYAYFQNKNYQLSENILSIVIKSDPNNSKANELLSYIYGNSGKFDIAYELLKTACNQEDCSPEALYYLGSTQLKKRLLNEAINSLMKSITKAGEYFEAIHDLATAFALKREFNSALDYYKKCLKFKINSCELLYNIARTYDEIKNYEEAIDYYNKALALKSDRPEIWFNKGVSLSCLNHHEDSIRHFNQALTLKPDYPECLCAKGIALANLEHYEESIKYLDKALIFKPDYAEAWSSKAYALGKQKHFTESITGYDKALNIKSDYAEAWSNKGALLTTLNSYQEAINHYDKAIHLNPNYAEAWFNKGLTLSKLNRPEEAIIHYDKAIYFKPDYAEAWHAKGTLLVDFKFYEEAIQHYEKALILNPKIAWCYGDLIKAKMSICRWENFDESLEEIHKKIQSNEKAITPFSLLSLVDNPSLHRKSAEIFTNSNFPKVNLLGNISKISKEKKIRLGYFSANYYDHAVGYLIAELFELHDKDQFELIGFSFGQEKNDSMRQRLEKPFNEFININDKSDIEVAQLSRDLKINIAIDLTGYTKDTRMRVFAYRTAPIQVSYLGYPGPLGAEYIDYIIGDNTVINSESQKSFSEKIVYLPNSYQVNDRNRIISQKQFSKKELGLPENQFIFCCFNNNHKILPDIFKSWMRILNEVNDSVLWLLEDNPLAANNLKKTAEEYGIDRNRIIFAQRMSMSDHLGRQRVADLFLDTYPYNAHTTASDALWAGLPILTLQGSSFASSVAASLLKSAGLSELITRTQQEYENLAIQLALNPKKLSAIKDKLPKDKSVLPLFDTPTFTKHIENAYIQMYEKYHSGLPPEDISVIP